MSRYDFTNGGSQFRAAHIAGAKTATAGGAGDNTLVNQDAWAARAHPDKFSFNANSLAGQAQQVHAPAQSAKLVISYSAALAAAATLSFAVQIRDASDAAGTGAAAFGAAIPLTVVKTAVGAATYRDTVEIDIDLTGAKGFIGAQITPDLSAANTDTVAWSAIIVFCGDTAYQSRAIANIQAA
jgi:hypothetical protein